MECTQRGDARVSDRNEHSHEQRQPHARWKHATIAAAANLAANSGSFTLLGGANFATVGGLTNSGSITLGPASTLAVNGAFTQTSSGTLAVQLGGTPDGGQFGKLVATGTTTLDGDLDASLVGGYQGTVGDSFTVSSFPAHTGSFATMHLPSNPFIAYDAAVNDGSVVLTGEQTATNLAVHSIDSISPTTVSAGQNVTVTYTVINQGATTSASNWTDSVFLSTGTTLNSSAILLGRVTHSGTLAARATYQATLTAPLQGVALGNYHVIVETDSGGQVPDVNRGDDVLASTGTLSVDFDALTLGVSVSGTIASGQSIYYKLNLPAGQDINLTAALGKVGGAELLVGFRYLPDQATFDQISFAPNLTTQTLSLTSTLAGTYFILLRGEDVAASGTSFVLTAAAVPLSISSFEPTDVVERAPVQAGHAIPSFTPTVTLTIAGSQFSAATTVDLVQGGTVVHASRSPS